MTDKTVLGLDAGHGGSSSGCSYNGIVEANWNMSFCRHAAFMTSALSELMRPVLIRTRDGEHLTLSERGSRSKEAGVDLLVCVHVNAHGTRPDFHGGLGFVMPGDYTSRAVAQTIMRCLPKPLHKPGWAPFVATDDPGEDDDWLQRPRNVIERHAAHCGATVLLEVGYASNENDAEALQDPVVIDGIVMAVLQGGLRFLQLKGA